MGSHFFKTALRKSCLRPYFPGFNCQLLFMYCLYVLRGFLKYGCIRPDIFSNNVSCFDMVWNEKKNCKHTFSFIFAFLFIWSSFKFFSRAKQKFKIFFFCDHNVMPSFWVISFLIKNKSMGLTFFKLQLHNCKKLTIHKLNLPKKHRNDSESCNQSQNILRQTLFAKVFPSPFQSMLMGLQITPRLCCRQITDPQHWYNGGGRGS